MTLRALCVLVLMTATACGDDSDAGSHDAAPGVDARLLFDASKQSCSADVDDCSSLDYQRVCDTSRSYCVECLVAADCEDPAALGPTCAEDNTCRCMAADDCQGNVGGSYCHPIAAACGCLFQEDCPANTDCEIEPYLGTGIRRCLPR